MGTVLFLSNSGLKWGRFYFLLVCLALLGSLLVSYIRARAEALGLECQAGLFTQAERVIVLALGLWLNQLAIALAIIVVFSFIAAGQRSVYVCSRQELGNLKPEEEKQGEQNLYSR